MTERLFFDSSVLLYLLADDMGKADRVEALLAGGGAVSVQVLNELTLAALRRFGLDWGGVDQLLMLVRRLCAVKPMTEEAHDLGRKLAERYKLPVHDAMIVAVALLAGADTLYSEDMSDGLLVEDRLRICNPFRAHWVQDTPGLDDADALRARLTQSGIAEKDVAGAVAWAREPRA